MKRSTKKLISILCVAFFILSVAVPAFAASDNRVDRTPQVEDGYEFTTDKTYPTLTIEEKNKDDFQTGDYFELYLTNAEWLDEITADGAIAGNIDVEYISAKLLGVTIINSSSDDIDIIKIPLLTKVKGEGEAKVTVDPRDSAVTGGTYVFAVSAVGKTITTIADVNKFSTTGELATIRIDETRIGALGKDGNQVIKLKLPPKFIWSARGAYDCSSGLAEADVSYKSGLNTRTLELSFDPAEASRDSRGSIFLKNLEIRADRDAPYGDVVIDVDGTNVTSEDLVVAKRMDYTINVSVAEVKEIVAGRLDKDNNKTAKITIKENLPGALIANRDIVVVLPEWVKPIESGGIKVTKATNGLHADDVSRASKQNEFYFIVNPNKSSTEACKYEFELVLSVEADKSGEIVAEISGAGVEKQEVVIAEAVAPITAEVAVTDLKIGVQNQPAPDIIITETKKGMIDDSGNLTVTLPDGIKFASTPEVEVTEGNLEVGKAYREGHELRIPIDSSSTKPSTIKISDVKLTLDRTVPEGEFKANIGGEALVKNYKKDATIKIENKFDKDNVIKFDFANVITPAPDETRATSIFTIDSTTYTVVEQNESVEKTMDVAPYIKDGRTFLPLRYVANALGVDDDNIIWDPVTKAVTIFKGDRIAQVTIGSKTMLVNGVTVNMDVAPEITDGRTMLPIRWMGQALGATIDWDAEARSVTVKQ